MPAIEVISPYRKPPHSACSSMTAEPELAGAGVACAWAFAAARRLEANIGDAASADSAIDCLQKGDSTECGRLER